MRLFISYISLFSIILLSCNTIDNKKYISSIDSLSVQLEGAADVYSAVDSLTLAEIRKKVKNNCDLVDYTDDTSFKKLIIPYSQISKVIKQILKMDTQIKKELQLSRDQISDLLHDVNDNLIDTTLLVQYIEDERNAVNILIGRMNNNQQRVVFETARYDSLNPIIDKLINSN